MSFYLISLLINCTLSLAVLALVGLLVALTIIQLRKAVYLSAIDGIEILVRFRQAQIDHRQQVLELQHRGKMLEVEADTAQMVIREKRLALLASLNDQ